MLNYLAINADCDSLLTPEAIDIIKELLGYIRIIAPALLLIFIAIDYGGAIINNDNDALTKANSKVVGRAIGLFLLFLVPTIVKFVLDTTGITESNDYLCENATGTAEKYVITSSPKESKKKTKVSSSSGGTSSGDKGSGSGSSGSGSSGSSGSGSGSSSLGKIKTEPKGGTGDISTKIGNNPNPKTEVCLENQPGLRDKYQSELDSKIAQAGANSRAAVVAAAIYISSEIGIKIPYFPGGCHSMSCLNKGIPKNIGCQKKVVHNAEKWPPTLPAGFDCSGFTFWVYGAVFQQRAYISSEMHNSSGSSSTIIDSTGKKVSVKLERVAINKGNYDYIKSLLMPGDLVGSDGHVGMVIDTSRLASEGVYTVAHASSRYMQLTVENFKLSDTKWNRFVLMRKFFLKYDCLMKNDSSACQKFDCVADKNCNDINIKY